MLLLPPLLAAAGDFDAIIKLAFIVIFVLGGLIKALWNTVQSAKQKKMQFPEVPQGSEENSASATIEEFLKRVNREREEARRLKTRSEPAYVEAEVIDAEMSGPESVSQHVARHMGANILSKRTLPHERMTSDDAAREAHFTKFAHQVGRLTASTSQAMAAAPEPAPPPLLPEMAAAALRTDREGATLALDHLLRSPEGLRQAMILNEIFNRPESTR